MDTHTATLHGNITSDVCEKREGGGSARNEDEYDGFVRDSTVPEQARLRKSLPQPKARLQ
jgi:hypothetical protein